MSAENVELVRRGFAAWARGDLDAIGEMLDPNVSWHGGDPNADYACHSRADAVEFMRRQTPRGLKLVDVVDAGDRVVVITEPPGRGGARPPRSANVTTIRDGLVTEMVNYESPEAALAAVGLGP